MEPMNSAPKPPESAYAAARDTPISPAPDETVGRRQGEGKDFLGRRKGPIRQEGGGWVYAPASSHLSRFMLVEDDKEARLLVVFRGPGGQGEVSEYVYTFPSQEEGARVFALLRSSPHPYSEVLRPMVIAAGIPYSPRAI